VVVTAGCAFPGGKLDLKIHLAAARR